MSHLTSAPNDLDSFWMPFTASRWFKETPRMIVAAKGLHYTTSQGQKILDGTGGLWCCNAGHGNSRIVEAIQTQAAQLDFAHNFNLGHPIAFQAASQVVELADGFDHVFFTNSGSEAVDTALKMALAYHAIRGEGQRRFLIGRHKAYHGINFGGVSVAGIGTNKSQFGSLYPATAHMRSTDLPENVFSKGQPDAGCDLANDLETLCESYGGHTIAAVIVEPVAGAGGVYPPPIGYLERLREICDKNGILLIFDEVITGFGRLGTPFAFDRFGVRPDLVTLAKGLSNATVPMGGVLTGNAFRETFLDGSETRPDLFHGYTYSGHPLACAAAIATLDVYRENKLFENAAAMEPYWQDMLHSLRKSDRVIDIRNIGLLGAIELRSEGTLGAVGRDMFERLWDKGLLVRPIGDSLAMSPPLSIDKAHIDEIGRLISSTL